MSVCLSLDRNARFGGLSSSIIFIFGSGRVLAPHRDALIESEVEICAREVMPEQEDDHGIAACC